MSTIVLAQDGLTVSTSAGPAAWLAPNSRSRMMVEIDATSRYERGSHARLDMDQWIDLVCFVRRLDRDGLSIVTTPEVE